MREWQPTKRRRTSATARPGLNASFGEFYFFLLPYILPSFCVLEPAQLSTEKNMTRRLMTLASNVHPQIEGRERRWQRRRGSLDSIGGAAAPCQQPSLDSIQLCTKRLMQLHLTAKRRNSRSNTLRGCSCPGSAEWRTCIRTCHTRIAARCHLYFS